MDEDQDEKLHQATATSSPLTDVYDLKSRSESNKSSDSEADDSDKISESRPVEMEDIQPERSIDEYRKKSETSSDDDRGKSRRDSVASGQTTPLDNEEGVYLPDRKRPIPFASVNQQDRSGRTLIFKYASRGDVDSTEALLKAGASLRIADYAGWTPLHEACLEGHTDIVRLMLAFDADVDSPGGDGDTPLHDAVGNVHYDVVKLLLQHGASIDLVNEQGQTALEFANEKLQESNIEYAANDYESPSKRNEAKLENEDAKKIYDLLLDWKDMTTKIVQRDSSGQTMLHHACAKGENDKVLELLQYGSDISAQDATGWSPLHNAALQGHADVVETLLRYGADVDACGFEDETPLHDAVANGHIQCASLLLQYGAEPFRKNKNGKMAKDLVSHGNHAMMELLEYPLDHWQPLKTREFYARLLTPCDPEIIQERKKKQKTGKAQSAVKKHSQKAAKHQSQNKNFAWGGLDSRAGPFESSREEKKFRALWQSIAKQDTEPTKPPTRESPVLGRPRQSSVDPVKPKVDTKKRSSVPPEETPTKKPKKDVETREKKKEAVKEIKKVKPTEPTPKREKESRPPLKPTPPPIIKKEVPVVIKPVIVERKEEKKKKRFAIAGYQRAGEIANDVSSESIAVSEDVVMRPATPTPEPVMEKSPSKMQVDTKEEVNVPIPVVEVKPVPFTLSQFKLQQEKKPEPKISFTPSSPAKTEISKPQQIKELDSEQKKAVRVKYCLPLCAYSKPGDSKPFSLPAADSSRWGIQSSNTRMFLDIQLAFCLGLESGRQLLDKYPSLTSRVASMVEKEALEKTIVSSRILKTMLKILDKKWINTTIVEGEEALKITDLDIHLISWTPELYQILKSHRMVVESTEKVDVDWIHDLKLPVEEVKPKLEVPQKYVHKLLKRYRS